MVSIVNNSKYLDIGIVKSCFEVGKYNLVDKQVCGNGFTTAATQIRPSFPGNVNIILEPNRAAVLDKQEAYISGRLKTKNRIGFFYGEGDQYTSDYFDINKYDVLFFVVDSFMERFNYLRNQKHRIEKILIDEVHSAIIQSEFRNVLKGFIRKVYSEFETTAITAVTATPLLFQKPSIVIENKHKNGGIIHYTQNQNKSIERAKEAIRKGEKVILATQNARLIKTICGNVIHANFKIGTKLKRSLVELSELHQVNDSNLTIISSTGFEGFDVLNGRNKVFIFEDRSRDNQTFYAANIIQIIGRSRKGVEYIEWCRVPHSKGRKKVDTNLVFNKILSRSIPEEKKVTDKNYKFLENFTTQSKSHLLKEGQFLLEFDPIAKKLYDETVKADHNGISIYRDFFSSRGFSFKYLDEGLTRFNIPKITDKTKESFIRVNRPYIKQYHVYDGLFLEVSDKITRKGFEKHIKEFLRRKYWEYDSPTDLYSDAEKNSINLISDADAFKEYCSQIIRIYKKKKRSEPNFNRKEYQKKVYSLEKNIESIVGRLILMFTNKKVKIPSKIRVWRDYNLLSEVSISIIQKVASDFNLKVQEFDIKSCNPRILYSLNGLDIPNDFYGENKKNKLKINTALNCLAYDKRVRTKTNKKDQKNNKKKMLRNLGIDEKVIDFTINKFFEVDKGGLFNFCSYHESRVIEKLKNEIQPYIESETTTMIRRHDSILVFGDFDAPSDVINNFKYLGKKGWFEYDSEGGKKMRKNEKLQKFTTSKNGLKAA